MALTFKPRSFVVGQDALKVLGHDAGAPIVFSIDLATARAGLDGDATERAPALMNRYRDVIEVACRIAYSKDEIRGPILHLDRHDLAFAAAAARKHVVVARTTKRRVFPRPHATTQQ